MKSFTITLAIVACVGSLFFIESVNGIGEAIKILSSGGKYIPGSVLKWIDIFQDIRKHTAPEGLEYVDYWISEVKPLDAALQRGDLHGVAIIFRNCLPAIRNLIPHLNDEKLKVSVGGLADNAENLLESLESKDASISASGLHKFFESESKNLGGILRTLIHNVVGLVQNVLKTVLHG